MRRTGRPWTGMGIGLQVTFSSGSQSSILKRLTKWCINTSTSSLAYSLPGHILGPPPNGTYVNGAGPFPSNLDGSNLYGSGKYSGFLWVAAALQYNFTPKTEKRKCYKLVEGTMSINVDLCSLKF